MTISETALPGVLLIEGRTFGDSRGYFLEAWNARTYAQAGLDVAFVQDNVSVSKRGVLRGLHLQNPHPQGKLVSVLHGSVYDVAVDVRPDSPHFGQWMGMELSAENGRRLYVPPGFAHGFVVTAEQATFLYKCTDFYAPAGEISIRWDDPDLDIRWPVDVPVLSEKDSAAPLLREIPSAALRTLTAPRPA